MNLDEWAWKNKVSMREMSRRTGIGHITLSHIKRGKTKPKLLNALRIVQATKGEVELISFLNDEDRKKLDAVNPIKA